MKVNLFDKDKSGKVRITNHVKDIYYLSAILEKYGEDNALKIFKIFDFVHNLNPNENPFANLPEENKYETVLRSTYPELDLLIDLEDELIVSALDLVGELYETPKYRAYKALKVAYDKLIKELEYTHMSLRKDDGNVAEVKKALEVFENLNKKLSESYSELEEEIGVIKNRGGVKSQRKKQEDLE